MRLLKNRSRGFYLCFVLLLTLAVSGSMIAHAGSGPGTAKATVNGGSLSESNVTNPESVQVNSTTLSQGFTTYTQPIAVIDARGSGVGWNLTITSTTFKHGQSDLLPTTASKITGVAVSCGTNSTCTIPTNSLSSSYPLGIPAASTPPTALKFFNAAVSSGLGTFSLTMTVKVTIPSGTKTGTYNSTVTLAMVNGP
jgi:WxL domain surface cell wall-binding